MKDASQDTIVRHSQKRTSSLSHFLKKTNFKNYFESTSILYFSIAVMFVLVFVGHLGDIHRRD